MTDTPITQAIEKVNAACPCADSERRGCSYRNGISCHCVTHGLGHHKCGWPGHRLVREVAKVAFGAGVMKEAGDCLVRIKDAIKIPCPHCKESNNCFVMIVPATALPREGVEDD